MAFSEKPLCLALIPGAFSRRKNLSALHFKNRQEAFLNMCVSATKQTGSEQAWEETTSCPRKTRRWERRLLPPASAPALSLSLLSTKKETEQLMGRNYKQKAGRMFWQARAHGVASARCVAGGEAGIFGRL